MAYTIYDLERARSRLYEIISLWTDAPHQLNWKYDSESGHSILMPSTGYGNLTLYEFLEKTGLREEYDSHYELTVEYRKLIAGVNSVRLHVDAIDYQPHEKDTK